MNIQLGSSGSETTFANAVVTTNRSKVATSYKLLDGSYKIQEAPLVKKLFEVMLVKPTSTEVTNIETEFDKGILLSLIYASSTYSVKFIGELIKSSGLYEITFTLQEV